MPIRRSMPSTVSTCHGSPLCDAQHNASSRSPKPKRSSTPSVTSGSAWNGLIADRANVTCSGEPALARRRPPASATATLTRCTDSTMLPR
jgi:hypothetical protein